MPQYFASAMFALAAAATLIWLFPREAALQLTLTDEGIEERSRAGHRQIPWSMVHEVWIRAVGVQVGGILGAGLAAAAEASRKGPRAGLSETSTNLHVRIVGPLGEIALTSNYRGVVAALAEVLDRVNPRLLEQALRQVKGGQTVAFGKVSVSTRGVSIGRAEPVPFTEIQKLSVEDGKVYLKKRGKWLSMGAGPAEKVPNLYVLMGLCEALSGGDIQTDASPDNGRQIV